MADLVAVRKAAWRTRRAKYGPRGHSGSYNCFHSRPCPCAARELIVRLHVEGTLSEGQAARALNLDRVTLRRAADDYAAG